MRVSDIPRSRDPVLPGKLHCSAVSCTAIALPFLTKIDPKGSVSMVTTRQTGFCDTSRTTT